MKGKHKHHIIPKHAGGSNDPNNFVYLTIEEHAEAHRKLYEEYGRWEDYYAYMGLSGQVGKDEIWDGIYHNRKTFLGKKHTEETKKKISETKKRQERLGLTKAHNEEWRKNQSEKMMGHKSYETQKRAVSEAMKGKPKSEEAKQKMRDHANNRSEEHKRKLSEAQKLRWQKYRETKSKV